MISPISRSPLASVIFLVGLFIASSSLEAATIRVDSKAVGSGDGSSWSKAKQGIAEAISAAKDGDEIWVAAGTYVESINMRSGIALYGGFSGTESSLDQRDPAQYKSIINAGSYATSATARRVVMMDSIVSSRLDGFVITGGKATCLAPEGGGGGIYCQNLDATNEIANCAITTNSVQTFYLTGYSGPIGAGGGVLLLQSSPRITSCTISGNRSDWAGAGIYCDAGSPIITGSMINNNFAYSFQYIDEFYTGLGGGIYCANGSKLVIRDTFISGNQACEGGGIYCQYSSANIHRCRISENAAEDYFGHGGGISIRYSELNASDSYFEGNHVFGSAFNHSAGGDGAGGAISCISGKARLTNCVVARNSASGGPDGYGGYRVGSALGAAIYLGYKSQTSIQDCTIVGNETKQLYMGDAKLNAGAGLFCTTSSTASVVNTIFQDNSGYAIYEYDAASDAYTSHCLFYNNAFGDYHDYDTSATYGRSDLNGGIAGVSHNYWGPAYFVEPANGDYHLLNGSFALDRGLAEAAPVADMDGNLRPGDDGLVDIGAYEAPARYEPDPEFSFSGRIYVNQNAQGRERGDSWNNAARTIQVGFALANIFSINEIWVAAGNYPESFSMQGGFSLYGGFAGTETSISERNPKANRTTLGGRINSAYVVEIWSIKKCRLDGFYITNVTVQGKPAYAIHSSSNPSSNTVVANCTISGNTGGVLSEYDYSRFENCIIADNNWGFNTGGHPSSFTLSNCIVSENFAGGILADSGMPVISNSIISGNGGAGGFAGPGKITNCFFDSNYGNNAVHLQGAGSLLANCILRDSIRYAVGLDGYTSIPLIQNCLFYKNDWGDVYDGGAKQSYTGGDSINRYIPGAVQNISGDPLFRRGPTGTWDPANGVSYDPVNDLTTLTNSKAFFTTGSLVGCIINPDVSQKMHAVVFSNTPHSLLVTSNLTSFTRSGESYEFMDYHITGGSVCIDAGRDASSAGYGGVTSDFEGDPRPYDGWFGPRGDGSDYDIGPDEYTGIKITSINRPTYAIDALQVGKLVYGDRTYQFTNLLPEALAGQLYIRTLNTDKTSTTGALIYSVSEPVTVAVALSEELPYPPSWLGGWRKWPNNLWTTDSHPKRLIYIKDFPEGSISLGPNLDPGMYSGPSGYAPSMYTVILVPKGALFEPNRSSTWTLY